MILKEILKPTKAKIIILFSYTVLAFLFGFGFSQILDAPSRFGFPFTFKVKGCSPWMGGGCVNEFYPQALLLDILIPVGIYLMIGLVNSFTFFINFRKVLWKSLGPTKEKIIWTVVIIIISILWLLSRSGQSTIMGNLNLVVFLILLLYLVVFLLACYLFISLMSILYYRLPLRLIKILEFFLKPTKAKILLTLIPSLPIMLVLVRNYMMGYSESLGGGILSFLAFFLLLGAYPVQYFDFTYPYGNALASLTLFLILISIYYYFLASILISFYNGIRKSKRK